MLLIFLKSEILIVLFSIGVTVWFKESPHPRWDDPLWVDPAKFGGMNLFLIFVLIISLWGIRWVMDQPTPLHKPNIKVKSDKMMDDSIPRTKHPLQYAYGSWKSKKKRERPC
jgi:hypothetical protein